MTLVKFNEGKNRGSLVRPGFDDIFESIMNDTFLSDRMVSRVPAVNISETDGHYHIELAAPGLKKDDFKVNLDRDVLTISAEHQSGQWTMIKNITSVNTAIPRLCGLLPCPIRRMMMGSKLNIPMAC